MDLKSSCCILLCLQIFAFLAHEDAAVKVEATTDNEHDDITSDADGRSERRAANERSFTKEPGLVYRSLTCPKRCRCFEREKDRYIFTDCSYAGFEGVPRNLSNLTTHLLLNNNIISDLPNNSFRGLENLLVLDLSSNYLQNISALCFAGLRKLLFLSLAGNKIYAKEACPTEVFKPLKNLEILHIERNCNYYRTRHCSYHDQAIKSLSKLKHLYIDGMRNTKPGPGFKQLQGLELLYMDGIEHAYCYIENLSLSWIENLSKCPLKYMSLLGCHIEKVESKVLSSFKNIQVLDLKGNDCLCTDNKNYNNLFNGLINSVIESVKLSNTCNQNNRLLSDRFKPLSDTKLERLIIDHSHIEYVDPKLADVLPQSIRYMSFRHNVVDNADFFEVVYKLSNLEELDFSNQFWFHFGTEFKVIKGNHSVISNNNKSFDSALRCFETASKQNEYEHCRRLVEKYMDDFPRLDKFKQPIILPPKLKILRASNVRLQYPVPKISFTPNNSLEYVDVSLNSITAFLGKISGLNSLHFLNLSYNRIAFIYPYAFEDLNTLRSVLLNNNNLGNSFLCDKASLTFANITALKLLDLSHNEIPDLPMGMFLFNSELKTLNLSHNALDSIEFSIQTLHSLENLDLSHNKIQTLPKEVTKALNDIGKKQKLHLNLTGNRLVCKCDNTEFIKWLMQSHVIFTDLEKENCSYINGSQVKLDKLRSLVKQLEAECITKYVLYGCITTFLVLLIVCGFVAALYNQRWYIKYLYYIGRKNVNPYHPIEEEEISMLHDVYISYNESHKLDSLGDVSMYDFVTKYLYPALSERGLRIILRVELESGRMLQDVISSNIRYTSKVLVMLTDDYCKDFWNTFEFNTAAHEGIYTKRNVIIPVMFENLRECNFPQEIWVFLKSCSIVRYDGKNDFSDFLELVENKIRNE